MKLSDALLIVIIVLLSLIYVAGLGASCSYTSQNTDSCHSWIVP